MDAGACNVNKMLAGQRLRQVVPPRDFVGEIELQFSSQKLQIVPGQPVDTSASAKRQICSNMIRTEVVRKIRFRLWNEVRDIVQETEIKTIPMEKKCKKAKWLSGDHFLLQCRKVKSEVSQSCPTLSDPMDCSLPGSPSLGFSMMPRCVSQWCHPRGCGCP